MQDAGPSTGRQGEAVRARAYLGRLWMDVLTRAGAVAAIGDLVTRKRGGRVFTPNLDHLRHAEHRADFREAYARASLSLADGMPLVWASRWFGARLPERVSGSDLIVPVAREAARRGWRVYLLGGAPGAAEASAHILRTQHGVLIAGWSAPQVALGPTEEDEIMVQSIGACAPDIIFVALGSPKQELWIDRCADRLQPAVLIGVGASLDFLSGQVARAPQWMGRLGFEWLFRLAMEPRRLWRRYLVEGPSGIAALLRSPHSSRVA